MVAVTVRDDDHVRALGVLLVLRALRIAGEERIDVDPLAARAVDAERRVSEPRERAGHEPPPGSKDAASLPKRLPRKRNVRRVGESPGNMHRSSLTAALLAATLVADANGAHSLALYLVLAAIPALAWTSLAYFGDLVDGSAADDTGALNVGLASLALALDGGAIPALGSSAVVGAAALVGLQLAVGLFTRFSRERILAAVRAARARA